MDNPDARPGAEIRAKLFAAVGPDRVEHAEHGERWGRFLAALSILYWLGSPERLRRDIKAVEDRVDRGLVKRANVEADLGRMRVNLHRAREAADVLEDVGFTVEGGGRIKWTGGPSRRGPKPDALTVLAGFMWRETGDGSDLTHARLREVAERLRGSLPDERLRFEGEGAPLYQAVYRYLEDPERYAPAVEALSALRDTEDP